MTEPGHTPSDLLAERFGPTDAVAQEAAALPLPPVAPRRRPLGGVWLVARTRTDEAYPCRCVQDCGRYCPCKGRPDAGIMPRSCCARRAYDRAAPPPEPPAQPNT